MLYFPKALGVIMSGRDNHRGTLRDFITSTLASMRTDMSRIESVISDFERKIDAIMNKIDDLEQRVSQLEKLLGVKRGR